jgi:hypothetical protein
MRNTAGWEFFLRVAEIAERCENTGGSWVRGVVEQKPLPVFAPEY